MRLISILVLMMTSFGCATGASDLNLQEVPKENGVFFGHIDFFNGDTKIDGSSMYTRCFVSFENEEGHGVMRVSMDETSWIFASAPVGRLYLAHVICNAGFLKSHPGFDTRTLSFPVSASGPTYFGHMSVHFDYHGTEVLGMFGLVGAVADAATSSGSRDKVEIKIENQSDEAEREYLKRYGNDGTPPKIINSPIQKL